MSESTSETSFESLQEAPTDGLRESTDELLPQSPIEVSERGTQNSSEASSDSPIGSLQDTSKIGLSELNNELKTDSPLDPLRGNPDATEELSESDSETVFESLQEAPTDGLRESTDESLPQSPMEVPEREKQNSSEASSKSPHESLRNKDLSDRLIVAESTLRSARSRPDFPQWCQKRDPDKIIWRWNPETKRFVPADENR